MKAKYLTPTVLLLSFVSFFNDIASDMLYPVLPIYLQTIGFSVFVIGLLEGVADATAGLSKIWFGNISDKAERRMPFVRWGYFLSAISKPLLAVFTWPLWVFGARTLDKLGKGLRTGARDAMLSAEAPAGHKGAVFGFHRGMDTLGASIGPALALLYLYIYPGQYLYLFYIAFFPAMLGLALTFWVKDKRDFIQKKRAKPSFGIIFSYWKQSSPAYRRLMPGLFLFAIFNSSDIFLLLVVKQLGYSDQQLIGFYIFFNLVYALASYPLGRLGDKIGLKKVLMLGIVVFALTYFGMSQASGLWMLWVLFSFYGLFWASTHGVAKAMISNITPKEEAATALGFHAGWDSIIALCSSAFAGWIWYQFGMEWMLLFSGGGALLSLAYFGLVKVED